jgi:hypothetical protein
VLTTKSGSGGSASNDVIVDKDGNMVIVGTQTGLTSFGDDGRIVLNTDDGVNAAFVMKVCTNNFITRGSILFCVITLLLPV